MSTFLRKQPKQDRGINKIDKIINSSEEVFSKYGYDAANTEMIAKNAGISIGSLYQFFPNKKAILQEMVERYIKDQQALQEKFDIPVNSIDSFGFFLETITDHLYEFNESHKCFKQLFNTPTTSPDVTECSRNLHSRIENRVFNRMKTLLPKIDEEKLKIYMDISMHMMAGIMSVARNTKSDDLGIIKDETKRMLKAFWIPLYERYS